MYIKERNGKYRYFQSYTDPLTEKRKTVSCTLNSKSRAAQKQARAILSDRIEKALEQTTITEKQKNIRLKEAIEEWMKIKEKSVKKSTFISMRSFPNILMKYIDGNALLKNITPEFIERTFNDIQYNSKMKVSTVKTIYYHFCEVMKYSKQRGYINTNPIRNVEITWKKENISARIEDKFLEDDELKTILDYAWKTNSNYGAFLEWLYLTGMRFGEAAGLKFDDIKEVNGTLFAQVNGTLLYHTLKAEKRYKTSSPKTVQSFRDVELSERAVEIIKFEKEKPHKSEFIFETRNGTPHHLATINYFLKTVEQRLNIKKHLTTHIFRHTHISKLAELGVPLYIIKQRVGHSSDVTEKIYLHVTKKARKKLSDKLDKL